MLVYAVVSSLVSLPETLDSRTTNPRMIPLLSPGNGGCHVRETLVTPVPVTVSICGAPDGTAENMVDIKDTCKRNYPMYHLQVL